MRKFLAGIIIGFLLVAGVAVAGSITATGMSHGDLYTFLSNVVTIVNELKADVNTIRTAWISGSGLKTDPNLAIGSTVDQVATEAFQFQVNGINYHKAAVAAGSDIAAGNLPTAKYGLWTLEIAADGTIDSQAAAANTTGYATEAAAIAAKPTASASHVEIGYITVLNETGGAFVPGTTGLAAAGVTTTYYDSTPSTTAVATSDLSLTGL